jgi:hypothetical protein
MRIRSLACLLSFAVSMTSGLAFADPVPALEVQEDGGGIAPVPAPEVQEDGGDPGPMSDELERGDGDALVLPLGCPGETIPWYQTYEVQLAVESCHFASPEGAIPWVGTTGQSNLYYNISAARIGYRIFTVVACGADENGDLFLTVHNSQFYSTNDAHCIVTTSGLGDDTSFVDRIGSSAITSLTPLIGD